MAEDRKHKGVVVPVVWKDMGEVCPQQFQELNTSVGRFRLYREGRFRDQEDFPDGELDA